MFICPNALNQIYITIKMSLSSIKINLFKSKCFVKMSDLYKFVYGL